MPEAANGAATKLSTDVTARHIIVVATIVADTSHRLHAHIIVAAKVFADASNRLRAGRRITFRDSTTESRRHRWLRYDSL